MTIKELKEKLDDYSDDLDVRIEVDTYHTRAASSVDYVEPMSSESTPFVLVR